MKVERVCQQCQTAFLIERGQVNAGRGRYCARSCFAESRRIDRPLEQKKAIKQAYDAKYRIANHEARKADKAAYYARTRDREKERAIREANSAAIAAYKKAYYAKPENKQAKYRYDRERRCKLMYGPFWEAADCLLDLEKEVEGRMSRYEINIVNQTYGKTQRRKRAYAAAKRKELEGCPLGGLELGTQWEARSSAGRRGRFSGPGNPSDHQHPAQDLPSGEARCD